MAQAVFLAADGKKFNTLEEAEKHERDVAAAVKFRGFLSTQGTKRISKKSISLLAAWEDYRQQNLMGNIPAQV